MTAMFGIEDGGRIRRQETIPLSEYGGKPDHHHSSEPRGEALRKIHAQSSAETSGLGDSLQRIHTLSSTETSGYGDTVPSPTAPSPSPERPRALAPGELLGNPGHSPTRRQQSMELMTYTPDTRSRPAAASSQDAEAHLEDYFRSHKGRGGKTAHAVTAATLPGAKARDVPKGKVMDPKQLGLNPEMYSADMDSYVPAGEEGSISRSNSFLGITSQLFMGRTAKSAWLKWSQDRRASFKRKLDHLEQRQREAELNRVSTPVRKARKESVMFVSPELEDQHLPSDDPFDTNIYLTEHAILPSKKNRRLEDDRDVKLTIAQWNKLIAFWEHDVFVRCRIVAVVLSIISLIFGLISITSDDWSRFSAHLVYGASYSGLWQICSSMWNYTAEGEQYSYENCTSVLSERRFNVGLWDACRYNFSKDQEYKVMEKCQDIRPYWQNAVIGLMIFSVAFGFLATVLSICGVCTTTLAKKIYYYHSAGEIYLICAFSVMAALIVYPVAIEVERKMSIHTYGYGYGLGWGSSFFFAAAAMCMCLDDLVRALMRGICKCCDNSNSGNTRV